MRRSSLNKPRGLYETKAIKSYHWINRILLCCICWSNYLQSHDTKHAHTHRIPTLSIKVEMAVLRCENDCISIGMAVWVHRTVLCMLMQAVKMELGFKRAPEQLHCPDKTTHPWHMQHFCGAFYLKKYGLWKPDSLKSLSLMHGSFTVELKLQLLVITGI